MAAGAQAGLLKPRNFPSPTRRARAPCPPPPPPRLRQAAGRSEESWSGCTRSSRITRGHKHCKLHPGCGCIGCMACTAKDRPDILETGTGQSQKKQQAHFGPSLQPRSRNARKLRAASAGGERRDANAARGSVTRKKVDWSLRYTSLVSSALAQHGIRSAAVGSNSRLQAGAYYSPPTDSPV